MQIRRSLVAVSMTLSLAAALAACGGGDSSDKPDSSAAIAKKYPEAEFPKSVYQGLKGTVSWYETTGGTVAKVREDTVFRNFKGLTGVPVKTQYTDGSTTKFMAAAKTGHVPWDVVEFSDVGSFLAAKNAGLLEPTGPTVATDDLNMPAGVQGYGVPEAAYGMVLAYNSKKYPSGGAPSSITDLYDTNRFPGKRCMFKYYEAGDVLESALLADGVPRNQLYPLDIDRALKKVDTIKNQTVWWTNPDQAMSFLINGQCSIGVIFSGRAFLANKDDGASTAISWNGATYDTSILAIPKGAPNPKAAQALLAFWAKNKADAIALGNQTSYAPPFKSLTVADFTPEARPFVTAGSNLTPAIAQDGQYYATHQDELAKKFTTWLSQ